MSLAQIHQSIGRCRVFPLVAAETVKMGEGGGRGSDTHIKWSPRFNGMSVNSRRKWQHKRQLSDFSPSQPEAQVPGKNGGKQRKKVLVLQHGCLCPRDN